MVYNHVYGCTSIYIGESARLISNYLSEINVGSWKRKIMKRKGYAID